MSPPLALDHLTVADATPAELIGIAAAAACTAVCMFLHPLEVLPRMPAFTLIGDSEACREVRRRCADLGVSIDLAYPFTLAGRTELAAFLPAMETAAQLGVRTLNVLLYDREPQRRLDKFAGFCELAVRHGLNVAVEFYPLSQVRSLPEAIDVVSRVGRAGTVGVNVDLLHLVRSGGDIAQVAAAPAGCILYAQYCDGPATLAPDQWGWEASSQRALPGEGEFPIRRFAEALPRDVPGSVEIPQDQQIAARLPMNERAARALAATRRILET